ncbi:uncharacterized protein LOC119693789 [Plutella xylostella]|uniref:uncharacterized protein LOC119693789 n=1 Tax=Plutella xylostella TaxID=51655 RepID=UPI002032DF06|nr:uncharacterized protein LOC119693789 [Plutella xylostella]
MPVNREKLIELVRKNDCLYRKGKKYKIKSHIAQVWEKIGAELGIEAAQAKESWRTMRDGYLRYKKHTLGMADYARNYNKYRWSDRLEFLDHALDLNPSDNATAKAGPESFKCEHDSSSSPPQECSYAESWQWGSENAPEGPTIIPDQPAVPTLENDKRTTQAEIADKVQECLRNMKREELDDVDHLFASYAKSFKKLSRRTQAELKIKLATLFAEAELTEL